VSIRALWSDGHDDGVKKQIKINYLIFRGQGLI
jgi:hypothetical protein